MNEKKITRRSFISSSCAGLISAGLIGPFNLFPGEEKQIIRRTLGRTGLKVPIVSMGVMNARNPEIIKHSFQLGVRLFDTAKAYGNGKNEQLLGQVVKDPGIRRQVILQTKILHPVGSGLGRSPEPLPEKEIKKKFIEKVNGSLRRLQTDYIDVLYYHAVDDLGRLNDAGVKEALLQLKKEGKTRFLGISTHSKILDQICAAGVFDIIMVQLNFIMADDTEHTRSIQKAAAKGLGIIAMKTQGGNRLAGSIMNHSAALKWVLKNEWVTTAIPGYTNSEQLKENFSAAYNLEYTKAEKEFLTDRKVKLGMNFCRWCRKCMGDCPQQIDVPTLMRVHMYAFGYNNFQQAYDTLQTIPESANIKNCSSCSSCSVKCRHTVDIAANIKQLKKALL
jgi:predicted aldo/keto reductase-like oxidoreductase